MSSIETKYAQPKFDRKNKLRIMNLLDNALTIEPITKACSRCYITIDSRALVCGHCQFAVGHHQENLDRRSISVMRRVQIAQSAYRYTRYMALLGERVGKNLVYAVGSALIGALLLLIPVVGWLVGGSVLLGAAWFVVSALAAPFIALFSTFNAAEQAAKKSREDNTYTDVICPACQAVMASGKRRTILWWVDDTDSTAVCKNCKVTSYRFDDRLIWVPHPQVSVTGSLKEFVLGD